METVALAILSPYAVFFNLYSYVYGCGHIPRDPQNVQLRNATTTHTHRQQTDRQTDRQRPGQTHRQALASSILNFFKLKSFEKEKIIQEKEQEKKDKERYRNDRHKKKSQ